jgi:uncharacterized protein YndB with AHSA1/START domain
MADIRLRVGIKAPVDDVFRTFATIDGLKTFWTQRIDGECREGELLRFYFIGETPRAVMRVDEIKNQRIVRWRCMVGPAEWVHTKIIFDISHDDDETAVLFTHADWNDTGPFMHHCSTKWAYFLLGLKNMLEGGTSVAYPNDAHISKWG